MWEFACLCWYPEYLNGGMEMRKSRDTKLNLTGSVSLEMHKSSLTMWQIMSLCIFLC